jgi:hypothetical protein
VSAGVEIPSTLMVITHLPPAKTSAHSSATFDVLVTLANSVEPVIDLIFTGLILKKPWPMGLLT